MPSSSSDVDVVAELRGRLEAAGLVATSSSMGTSSTMTSSVTQQDDAIAAAVAAETAKHESTIAELKSTNDSLKAKLKTLYKTSQDSKQRHAKDVAKLQKTVSELQKRAREQQQMAEVENAGGQTTAGGDVSGEVGATSTDSRNGVVLPPVNVASPQSRVSLTNPQATSAGNQHQNPAAHLSTTQAPASPVTMPPLALPRNSPTTTPRANPPTTAIVLPSLASDTSAYQNNNINDQSSNTLRSQVCYFCLSVL